jgi:hypothetical protein
MDYMELIIPAAIAIIAIGFGWLTSDAYRQQKLKQIKVVIHELTDTVVETGVTLKDFDNAMADDKISEAEAAQILTDLNVTYGELKALRDAVIALIGPSPAELAKSK